MIATTNDLGKGTEGVADRLMGSAVARRLDRGVRGDRRAQTGFKALPDTCRSKALRDKALKRAAKDGYWPGPAARPAAESRGWHG